MPRKSAKRKPRIHSIDSSVWRLNPTPPETSFGVLPFTIQGNLIAFNIKKENNYTLNYPGVVQGLNQFVSCTSGATLAVRVTHVGVFGKTSTAETIEGNASHSIVTMYDSYTGRSVRGVSDYTKRARAGIQMSMLRQLKWYNLGSLDTFDEKDIVYFRKTGANTCPDPTSETNSYDVVVRGFVRFTAQPGTCG